MRDALLVHLLPLLCMHISNARSFGVNVTWVNVPPYVFLDSGSDVVTGAIHALVVQMTRACCAPDGRPLMTLRHNRSHDLEARMVTPGLAYPVTRRAQYTVLDGLVPTRTFLPIIELPGAYIVQTIDRRDASLLSALSGLWPLALLVFSSSGVAGFIVWLLDRTNNSEEFPESFIRGGWEGLWWAVVTATTVGYGDRLPRSMPARLFGLIWMFTGIILMSVFTATLVSALQAEDQVGMEIKGARVGVVNGSEEQRYAFIAGAIPVGFATLDDALDGLVSEQVEAAMVDPFYTLYFSDKLHSRGLQTVTVHPHIGVRGILAAELSSTLTQCFAKFVLTHQHIAFDFLMANVGSVQRLRGHTAHHTSRRLVGSNMVLIYTCCTAFTTLFILLCVWEFVWYKPRLRRKLRKEQLKKLDDEQRLLQNDSHAF